ncbi:MAG: hypothetical protein KDD55_07980 [Bdellovibrionales bacterium]|nr:hypothetical protein [Bdellovibrionales bacterium]
MKFTVITTFGPSLRNKAKLEELNALGDIILRINGAHINPEQVSETVSFIRDALPKTPIMMDLPGNKVRLQHLGGEVPITKGEPIEIHGDQLNYREYAKHLSVGDHALTHDSKYTLEVTNIDGNTITFIPHQTGTLLPNKGLHVAGANKTLPFLFDKDKALIRAAVNTRIDILSLSFVRNAADIKEAKNVMAEAGSEITIFSKVETEEAIENLGEIFYEVDTINVDRGDLSADIGVLRLPLVQERIIDSAQRAGKNVFLATQFLHNMEEHPVPLIPEIVDLYNTIKRGVSGIQLSEETAVGRYPIEATKLVFDMHKKSYSSS